MTSCRRCDSAKLHAMLLADDKDASGHSNSLPDSPPLLNSDDLLNELFVISSQERQQLDDIEGAVESYCEEIPQTFGTYLRIKINH